MFLHLDHQTSSEESGSLVPSGLSWIRLYFSLKSLRSDIIWFQLTHCMILCSGPDPESELVRSSFPPSETGELSLINMEREWLCWIQRQTLPLSLFYTFGDEQRRLQPQEQSPRLYKWIFQQEAAALSPVSRTLTENVKVSSFLCLISTCHAWKRLFSRFRESFQKLCLKIDNTENNNGKTVTVFLIMEADGKMLQMRQRLRSVDTALAC